MTYAAIMVYVDTGSHAAPRVGLACDIASVHGATVIGLSASVPTALVIAPTRFGSAASEGVVSPQESAEADLKYAERVFRKAAAQRKCRLEWRCSLDSPARFLAHQARAADLIVVGQVMRDISPQHLAGPVEILAQAGRPILVVPPTVEVGPLGTNAVIAWKDSREARRAVLDALPLLQKSRQVSIVDIASIEHRETAQSQADDVAVFLRRHGIQAEAVVRTQDGQSLTDHLLTVVREKQAGLIVMGGQTHMRLHDWTFGSVTHEMLKTSPVCLLLSN